MLPADLISEAREYHPDFVRDRTPTRVLIRRLRQTARRIVRKAIEVSQPEVLATVTSYNNATIVTALDDTAGLLTPPAFITPIGARAYWSNSGGSYGETPVQLVGEIDRLQGGTFFPSIQVLDSQIRFTDLRQLDNTYHGWEDVESVDWAAVLEPELDDPADLASSMTADLVNTPDALEGALVMDLALFLCRRLGIRDTGLREDLKGEIADWIYSIQLKGAANHWRVGPMPAATGPFPVTGLS